MTAEMPGHLGVAALIGVVVHLRAESLIPTCREVVDVSVGIRVQYLAHRLFPDHPLAVHTAPTNAIGDGHDPLPGHDLQKEGGMQGTGAEARHTVMNEKDLLPAMIRHAHLVPEDPVGALRLSLRVARHVLRHELAEEILHHQCLARGLDNRLAKTAGGDHLLVNQKNQE
jgi:serine/arginine repetitive matrix protein 1